MDSLNADPYTNFSDIGEVYKEWPQMPPGNATAPNVRNANANALNNL
jgi:hypothetical protein